MRRSRERFELDAEANEKPLEDFQQRNCHDSKYINCFGRSRIWGTRVAPCRRLCNGTSEKR